MIFRWFAKSLLLLAGCAALQPAARTADNDAAWKILKQQVTHRRNYEFLLRDHGCLNGWIEQVDDDVVEITTSRNGKPVKKTLVRRDIVHVSDTLPGLVYSGRNSWADVRSSASDPHGLHIRAITKAGQTVEGTGASASESDLTVKTARGDVRTAKSDVARVELLREKPWSDRAEFAGQELGALALIEPEIWPHLLHAKRTITVPLYDASAMEDNTEANCAEWDRGGQAAVLVLHLTAEKSESR